MPDPALVDNAVTFDWAWSLEASPERLWPLVSDTNRINQLAKMAPVGFSEAPDAEGGASRTGETTQLGFAVSWDEHPFEWAYPFGFTVLREFHNGVLQAYRSTVTLTPEGTGTRLTHRVELLPRLGLMAPFVQREGTKQHRNWNYAYRAIDAYLAGGAWPFQNPGVLRPTDATMAMAAEIRTGSEHPELELRLFEFVLTGPDDELINLRPYVLADRWRTDRATMLDLCRYAAGRQLLTAQWSLLCPHCRGAKGTVDKLSALARNVYCASCNIHFEAVDDSAVELTFRPDARYRRVQEATYCVGGPGSTPHIYFQAKLHPLANRDVSLRLEPGRYRLRSPRLKAPFNFNFHGGPDAPEEKPTITVIAGAFEGEISHFEGPKLELTLASLVQMPVDVLIETRDWRDDVVTLAQLRDRPDLLAAFGG